MHFTATLAALTAFGWLVGCAATSSEAVQSATNSNPREVAVFRGADGSRASWADLVTAAASSDVVLIGENHGHPLGLASAAALFDDVLARSSRASLSLEFFERDDQSRVDDYLAGIADLETFEKRAALTDHNFPPGHRAMVEAAKRAGRPVHASNAPWEYVTLARKQGYDRLRALTPEQQRTFRIPDELFGGRYREAFDEIMTPEGKTDSGSAEFRALLDDCFRSQSLWDWTMSESIVRGLHNGEQPVVQVIGHFHVDFRGGTVQALERQRPDTSALIVSFSASWSDQLAPADRGRADFVIYVGPSAEN